MRSEGDFQSHLLMHPALALQSADGTSEKGGAGKYESCHFLRSRSIVPWCMLLLSQSHPVYKRK